MKLLEAIKSRKSIRAYKPDPVSKEVLTELLDIARWAPSATNTQPWEFFVLTGKVLDDLNRTIVAKIRSGDAKPNPDVEIFETPPKGTYSKRQQKFFEQILGIIEPVEGKDEMQNWFEMSVGNYGAPDLIVIVADTSAPGWFVFDIGIVTQTIALAAQEYGLGTCILGDAAAYPDEVRRIANIPESKQIIIGIAIGYPDWNHSLNSLRTGREPVEELVTWCGVAEE
uniref:Bifunctional F420 biosynthesis protein FbiB n=1 Tax=Candidatus Methanogaster sp. ANME-2c ERB4 TaxID=2759911 RepID=A0A7G9YEM1_9EURY|nr:bifunctional F420 biosynthesis protein FbiB [Methanosarcinales archaeon ANME-2c ERB4]